MYVYVVYESSNSNNNHKKKKNYIRKKTLWADTSNIKKES